MLNVVFSKEKINYKNEKNLFRDYLHRIGYKTISDYNRLLTPEIMKWIEHKERLNAMYAFDTKPIQV